MKVRTLLLLLVLFAIVLFAALNWTVFTTPATLSLLVATIEAPLGVIMLGLLVLLTALFSIFAGYMHTSTLLDARQQTRALEAQRKLADQAEASRITEMQNLLNSALLRLEQQVVESRQATNTRLDRLEQDLRAAVTQEGTTLSAYIGQLEDRLDREHQASGMPPLRGG
jgi:uncharacterized integral membrane protein